jgi:hypothetical protein
MAKKGLFAKMTKIDIIQNTGAIGATIVTEFTRAIIAIGITEIIVVIVAMEPPKPS